MSSHAGTEPLAPRSDLNLTAPSPITSPPLGGILDRYLIAGYLKVFFIAFLCMTPLPLVVDFFERVDNLLKADASLETALKYFLYKLPFFASWVFGFAALFATFFSIGILSRNHEITAMRSSGISLQRLALPLILFSVLISLITFFWNETVVPPFSRQSEYTYQVEVRKKRLQNLLGTHGIWLRGKGTFISADFFDAKKQQLHGLIVYFLDRDFNLQGLIEARTATWNGQHWEAVEGTEWTFLPDGQPDRGHATTVLPLSETPEDFTVFSRKPEELSFFELRKYIEELKSKGIDTSQPEVDLQVKLALPLISPLMVFLALPMALRHGPRGGMALSSGLTMLFVLSYWIVLGVSRPLGTSGVLPPWVAAWFPNLILGLVGLFVFTGEE